MSLIDLTPDEDAVLLAWARAVVQADGDYSAAESAEVAKLRDLWGRERFDRAVIEARTRFPDRAAIKDAAKQITRPEARRPMYAFLHALAASDDLTADEERPLRWLASWWQIEG